MNRSFTRIIALALMAVLLVTLAGCESDGTAPVLADETAPVLPDAGRLNFDLSFFDSGEKFAPDNQADKALSKANFFNAYLRATIINLVTHFVLTPPVAAFSIAIACQLTALVIVVTSVDEPRHRR